MVKASDTYTVWQRDDWGMDFVMDIPERDVALVMATFKVILCGRSVILV